MMRATAEAEANKEQKELSSKLEEVTPKGLVSELSVCQLLKRLKNTRRRDEQESSR